MNSLRDLRSSLVTSRYQLPQLTSHYVLCLCVTCQLKCPMLMSSLCLNPLVSSIPSILVFFHEFPSVANGTRRLVMSFRDSIPSSVSVFDFPVRVFHAGEPVTCSICHESGHLPRDCPFSGLCLRCKQPGSHGPRLSPAMGSVQFQFQSSCAYFVCACFLSSVCAVLRVVFVIICTCFHYPVYACAIRCHPLLSRPLLCLLLCHLSSLRNLLLLKMERLLCLPMFR